MEQKFFWGAATSSHQVEGGNHNDWSEWEKKTAKDKAATAKTNPPAGGWPDYILNPPDGGPNPLQVENYISGRACDHYNRFREDFDIAKRLGHNAHRFSIEWSRIEPEEGKWNEKEIEHYREVVKALRERGMEPFVTLWHWTLPLWLAKKGGILNKSFPEYFARYAEKIVSCLKDDVVFWLTLNEPTSVILNSYYLGIWPPQKRGAISAIRAFLKLSQAHKKACGAIRSADPNAKVGFVNILSFVEPKGGGILNRLSSFYRNFWSNRFFLYLVKDDPGDFLAVDYYFHFKMKFPGRDANDNLEVSDMGWEIFPEGIYHVLKDLKRYNLPIYITENGLADARDTRRAEFIKKHIEWIEKAVADGVDVRGYFYWSLTDNFEWAKGFWPRFGLVEINYRTMERKIRPSAWEYKKIIDKQ